MTQTEQKVFEIISKRKRVRISEIAKATGLSTDYTRLICIGLQRNGFINFLKGLCSIKSRSKNFLSNSHYFGNIPKVVFKKFFGRSSVVNEVLLRGREKETFEKKTVQKRPKMAKRKEVAQEKKEVKGEKKKIGKTSLFNLESVDEKLAKRLIGAGFKNIESLSEAPISRLMEISGIELKQAADIINEARKKLGKLGGSKSLF